MNSPQARWLLLFHQIPPKPDYLRVKIRRQLDRVGAFALKNSVYVLPNSEEATEDLQWVLQMVTAEGGEATICEAAFVDGERDSEVEARFRERSDAEYGEIIDAIRAFSGEASESGVQRFRRQLSRAAERDFFGADQAAVANDALLGFEASVGNQPDSGQAADGSVIESPQGATWVTRKGVFVDRIASAWLIRRFIDQSARFRFVPPKGYVHKRGELRFDMFEGEYGHEGSACTFETLVTRFGLRDPALRVIGEIVHDIDFKDAKFARAETAGVASVLRGIADSHSDDNGRLEVGSTLFDGLYSAFRT